MHNIEKWPNMCLTIFENYTRKGYLLPLDLDRKINYQALNQ